MTDEAELQQVTLAILAGGQSARMGMPKAHLQLRGRAILHHILAEARWPGPTLLVTAPGTEHPPGWEQFDREIYDPVAGQGPLRGVLTALQAATTAVIVVAPVDMPCFAHAPLRHLAGMLIERPTIDAVMLRAIRSGQSRIEPLPLALRVRATPMVLQLLSSPGRAMRDLQAQAGTTVLNAPADWPDIVWTNLNQRADLDRYLASDSAADPDTRL